MWYLIDGVDRVAGLCPEWEDEAARNGAPGLLAPTVIGRPIWAFIEGEATCFHYAQAFETVRQTGKSAEYRIRGDGPKRQALLELKIAPMPRDGLRITTQIVRERAVIHTPLWDRQRPRSGDVVVACSWCKAIKVDSAWQPVGQASRARPDLRASCPPEVVHHVCPGCAHSLAQGRAKVGASTQA